MRHLEYHLQKQICTYLSNAYPRVNFLSDTIASVHLTVSQASRNKAIQKHGFKTPDLIILHPNHTYHGLMIELKIETPYKKNGQIKSNEHLVAQEKTINQLNALGYYSCFAWSFNQARLIIDNYINNKL